jgi:hypothetical protein
MPETNRRESAGVRVVVEVDGHPIGVLELDMERLWPLLNHRKHQGASAEWMDRTKLESVLRAAVVKRLIAGLERPLYSALGDEIVKAELEIESIMLRAETAVQTFGSNKADVDKLVAETGRTMADFNTFFWDYLLADRDPDDLKKEWKAAHMRPQ